MPAKYLGLGAFAEDRRPDLHRQVGCVTGILQAFDRRHPLASSHKRLLPPPTATAGHALSSSPSKGGECTRYSPQIVLEKNSSKTWADSQRAPATELSQTSYSSSPSSSFSSLDGNRSTQQDLSSTDRMLFPERPFKSSPKLKSSFDSDNGLDYPDDAPTKSKNMPIVQSSLPTLGIRNLVKDSIYKDSRELSVRICTEEEVKDHPSNCGDQPRQLNGPPHDSTQGKSKGLVDINESLRVLAKLREASWTPPESAHHARLSYDAPRFSYDGKEAASKLREVPRLSLDIKEGHLWNREIDSRSNPRSADRSSNTVTGSNAAIETQQEQPACKRLPSVVAKLMGLEELPEHNQSTASSHAWKTVQESKQDAMFNPSSISSHDEHALRQQRNHDSTARNLPNSKFPVETAPWKQQERIVLPRRLPKGSKGAHAREQPAASVFSDIEKRLKDLDFQQSNKDLRALKQILDSMQAKGLLENKKREEASMPKLYDGNHDGQEVAGVNMRLNTNTNNMWMPEENNAESSFKSPIVIMKPSKSANLFSEVDSSVFPLGGPSDPTQLQTSNSTDRRKASMINRTAKEQHAKFSQKVPTSQPLVSYDRRSYGRNDDSSNNQKSSSLLVTESSSRRQQLPRDGSISMQKNKNSTSPRLLQRKLDSERRARPPIPSAEYNKIQRQSGDRNNSETVSPRSKFRRKLVRPQEGDDGMPNGLNNRTRSLNQHGNDMSTKSNGNISVASELDIISNDRSAEVNVSNFEQGIGTPSGRNPQKVKISYDASKDVPSVDPLAAISERPSPVSVLDSSFDQEDLFPTSRTPNSLAVDDERQTLEAPWKPSDRKPTEVAMQSKNNKLANVASLLEKLQQLSVNKDEDAPPVDHIAFLCETESPDHRYVSEILLASGLLMKDLGSGQAGLQLHSSGYPINPDLFHVLEQRKAGWASIPDSIHQSRSGAKSDPKRAHRKLLFDTVNELLLQKFEKETAVYSVSSYTRAKDPPSKTPSGQQLLKLISSGIEDLDMERSSIWQKEGSVIPDAEILQRLQGWSSFSKEFPGMVLEIERSIFKELVDEVVHGESADGPEMKVAGRRRRRLFA
ncbi:hypothetical protein BDA96_02G148200 [Sorghum bicolor]|uniref:DUF4378 domain-containing protein n=2 Tax=Sorghum bicolor TaxID=4558 RepID=A0A921UTQ8_SORBI|nr:protein LONGIFOLIA 1 isoform X1 [Sorghum bicolor]EER98557.1 hypothetical protein SORBI_3002G142500 [Sorghum bicolor]KAG0542950.1 hypothetical protein BDA96_02G148200 [Sorghum bicolor]|eukprot:XP_002462036.1 protein LONGIFOLIA 1 isoform X1 [Sorghum bicolor]